jgi:hypothetical protein
VAAEEELVECVLVVDGLVPPQAPATNAGSSIDAQHTDRRLMSSSSSRRPSKSPVVPRLGVAPRILAAAGEGVLNTGSTLGRPIRIIAFGVRHVR